MEIEILDADIFYAEALAGKLKAIHPDIRFKVCRTPSETRAAESLAGEEKDLPEDYLLICTKEHFPESRFRAPVMFLSDPDSSALKTPEDEENLPRLAPLSEITAALASRLEAFRLSAPLAPVSAFCLPYMHPAFSSFIKKKTAEAQTRGRQSLILEAGPGYCFPQSVPDPPAVPAKEDFLLALSLQRMSEERVGEYFELHPEIPFARRLLPPKHSDDWLLLSPAVFRQAIEVTSRWAEAEYGQNYRLFVLCCALPFRLCAEAAALSDTFYAAEPEAVCAEEIWAEETAGLTGLLPSGALARSLPGSGT